MTNPAAEPKLDPQNSGISPVRVGGRAVKKLGETAYTAS